jgi:Lipid A 3-O-deacylase (PagL)
MGTNRFIGLVLILLPLTGAYSQSEPSNSPNFKEKNYGIFNFIEFRGHFGNFVKHSDSLTDVLEGNYRSAELRIGFQSTGKQEWQHSYKLPSYGLGLYHANLNSPKEIGNPLAAFFFFNVPIIGNKKLRLNYDFSTGIAFNFHEYDSVTNPRNDVLGSKVNIYFNLGIMAYYQISERLDLSLGADFSHFSNGAIRTPNKGLNIYGVNAGIRYYLNPVRNFTRYVDPDFYPNIRSDLEYKKLGPAERYFEFTTVISGGLKTTSADLNDRATYHPTFTLALDGAIKYNHKGRAGFGVDYFYDGSMKRWLALVFPDSSSGWKDYSHVGIHIGHDLLVQKVALVTQVGIYLYSGTDKGSVWARVGIRYDFSERIFGRVTLKTTDGLIADLTEWGIGFRLHKKLRRPKDLY